METKTVIEKRADLDLLLDEYDIKLYLNTITIREISLGVSSQTLLDMAVEDIFKYSWDLSQYSLALTKEYNRHLVHYNWANSNCERGINRKALDYEAYGWENKRSLALANNEEIQQYDILRQKAKTAIDNIKDLASQIKFQAELAKNAYYMKRQSNKHDDYDE
jgi:hypothetical protein